MGLREDGDAFHLLEDVAAQHVEAGDALDLVAEVLHPHAYVLVGGDDLQHVAAHPEAAVEEVELGALVLHVDQPLEGRLHALVVAAAEELEHAEERLGRAEAVDAGDGGDDDHVPALEQHLGGAQPQPVDLLVDAGLFLDIGVRRRNVGLGLVVVVIGDEVFDGALLGKKLRNSWKSCAASVLLWERMSVGRFTASMTLAMVNVLPEPVTPSRICSWSPRSSPSVSWRMASGWSP